MEVIINKKGQETVVGLVGRLDTPASIEIAPQIEDLKEATSGTVILDCKDLEYISSSGLRLFLGLRKAAAEKGGKIVEVEEVIEMDVEVKIEVGILVFI